MKIVVQLSGGKDSVATLLLALKSGNAVTAVFNDMGDSFPHVKVFIEKLCSHRNVPLVISRPERSVLDSVWDDGLPSDIVPIWSSWERDLFNGANIERKTKIQSGIECCRKNLFVPIMRASLQLCPDEIWRGSKSSDPHVTTGPDDIIPGTNVKIHCPIWAWSDEMVFEFLKLEEQELPEHYYCYVKHSADCMTCTAWLDNKDEWARARYTKEFYPVQFEELKRKMSLIDDELSAHTEMRNNFTKELQ
jgi:3'-phosphoadenosine 5'-phosphosulfate sulfotransferase (PAPS reductase)/FAD synthetase